jgi:hypothetical protein
MMKPWRIIGILTICGMSLVPFGALAAPTLDQVSDAVTLSELGFYNVIDRAQTFTVGLTGFLTQVDIKIHRLETLSQDALFDIRTTSGGIPTEPNFGANILFNAVIPQADVPEVPLFQDVPWTSVFLGAGSFPVTAGNMLAISLRSDGDQVYWLAGSHPNPYPSGIRYTRDRDIVSAWIASPDNDDVFFRTWVDPVPVPPSVVLLGSGLLGLVGLRRLRKS